MFRVLFFFVSVLAKVGSQWDPNGLTVPADNDAGSHWDPNG